MKTIKLKIHSAVDLITNSSTTIFTYSDGALSTLKELVNEMLKTFGKTETFDDIFYAGVFLDDNEGYYEADTRLSEDDEEYVSVFDELNWQERAIKINETKLQVLKGEIEKPDWMIETEGYYNDSYLSETNLEIIPKSEKYQELANKLIKFLYSTNHEASYS